jgi:endo-1,4-beta-xylanase
MMKISHTLKVFACTIVAVFSQFSAASWVALDTDVAIANTRPVFDRVNKVYVSTVSITNHSATDISGPLRLLIDNSSIPVSAEDGLSEQGVPYFTLANTQLAAGETITLRASFELQRKALSFDGVLQHDVPQGPPMAEGQDKFVGGVCCGRQRPNFEMYFNQVTPENAGKWGSVENVRDVYNWTELDESYQLAKENNFIYKHHVLTWGSQQPSWISALPAAEQLEEILEWYNAVNNRYASIDFIEVVNEFDNAPPDGGNGRPNYVNALRLFNPTTTDELITQFMLEGDDNATATNRAAQFDWIINAFQMARNIFPSSTKLMINEYSVINTSSRTDKMLRLAGLLLDRELIDALGFQGHAFSTTGGNQNMINNMDRLAQTGLDLYVTELDIDGPTDLIQLLDYQRLFPMFWEHPAIKGITLWGYLPGHWRENQGAYLALEDGTEKPALVWLRGYIKGMSPLIVAPAQVNISEDTAQDSVVANLSATAAGGESIESGTEVVWSILGGNSAAAFTLDASNGQLKLTGQPAGGQSNLLIQVKVGDYTSNVLDLKVNAPGDAAPVVITYDFVNGLENWRGDYGTPTVLVHNAAAQAAEIVPDWSVNAQNVIGQIAETDYTGATVEYTLRVTQAQVDAGMTAQGYVQTGAQSSYARMYGPAVPLVAGLNTFSYTPTDNGNNDIQIIERVSIQLNGNLLGTAAQNDTVLIEKVTVTFPPKAPTGTQLEYDFVTNVQGWRNDYGTNSSIAHNSAAQAAEIFPDVAAASQNLIKEIAATDFNGASIEYTLTVTQAQVNAGMTAQAYVQTGDPSYARIYGSVQTLVAGSNTFSFNPVDNASGDLAIIQRVALQLNANLAGTAAASDTILLEKVLVNLP